MAIPTGEQHLRLADLINERKLSSVGLQEAMDRHREMELFGLYKKMMQTVRSLFANRNHFKLWQMAELAVITRAKSDMETFMEECGKDESVGGACFDERMKAYLTLASGLFDAANGTEETVWRMAVLSASRLLVERGGRTPWDTFDWWRQMYEVSRNEGDYQRMIVASKALSYNAEMVAAYGILEQVNPDVDRYGSCIGAAIALLEMMPVDMARFEATAKLALTVHDKRCYDEFATCHARIKLENRFVSTSLMALAVVVNYPEFGAVDLHDYQIALGNVDDDYDEERALVNTIVDGLLAAGKTDEVQNIVCHLPACSAIKNTVLARLTRFYLDRSLFPEARRHYDSIESEDQLLGMEILCAEVKANQSKRKNSEILRQYVGKMEKGYHEGLIMVADTTCEPRDIADAFEAVNSPKDIPHHRINMTLPLIRIAKRELDKLYVK